MKENGTEGNTPPKGKNLNNFNARGSRPKETLLRKGFLLKQTNTKGMLVRSPKEHASIATKWGITPKIVPSLNQGMGALR
jgi:hypothetical protein